MSKSLSISNTLFSEYKNSPIISKKKISNFLKNEKIPNFSKIHKKMLFDCLNEILVSFRPFAKKGQIMPLQNNFGICNISKISENQLNLIFEISLKKIFEWKNFKIGFFGNFENFWKIEFFRKENFRKIFKL